MLHYEQVNASRNRKVLELQHIWRFPPWVCRVASLPDVVVFGFSCQADETTVASQTTANAPEKEPTTKQQIGKWLVGCVCSLAIVTFGWDMWRHRQEQERHRQEQERHRQEQERHRQEQERHRQEQERVKNIIVNASFKAREPRVKIERKIIKASKHHLFFCCVCLCVS